MKYSDKIKYATAVAEGLQNEKSLDEIKADLKEQGFYDKDVQNIIISARNILGEKINPIIREKLLSGESISDDAELRKYDPKFLEILVDKEKDNIKNEEERKVRKLVEMGVKPEQIVQSVNMNYVDAKYIKQTILKKTGEDDESTGGGVGTLVIGLILMGAGIGLTLTSGALFYGAILVGLGMVIKGIVRMVS